MASISVRNFGPLRKCDVNLRKFSVLIGPQGSGKSTLARICTSFAWIEKSICRGSLSISDIDTARFRSIIGYLQLDDFLEEDTVLSYSGKLVSIEYAKGSISIKRKYSAAYTLPKLLYIPSERSYISISENFLSAENLPSVFYELASDYSIARAALGTKGFNIPVNGFQFYYADSDSIIRDGNKTYSVKLNKAASGIQSVLPLSIVFAYYLNALQYQGKSGFSILSVQKKTRIQNIASRFSSQKKIQDDNPFMNVLRAADISRIPANEDELSRLINRIGHIVDMRLSAMIEEPEQNLFPLAQKELVEYLVRGINTYDGSIIMTTHSPYILASIDNLIYAGEHRKYNKEDIDRIIDPAIQIRYKDVSAYYFHDGSCDLIMDPVVRNIDPAAVDSCSAEINRIYSELEDARYGIK